METLEGQKGAGIRNKQEEAGRALATNFYIWFIVTQVIFHLLNTLPDLPLFYTCCISQAFERIKKCWLLFRHPLRAFVSHHSFPSSVVRLPWRPRTLAVQIHCLPLSGIHSPTK